MTDLLVSALVLLLLCGAAGLGQLVLKWLPEAHRTRETMEFARLATGLIVTFTALVLGLLIASVNTSFDKTGNDLRSYGSTLIRLTTCLDAFGPATRPIRADLRGYTASALASTWADEAAPTGRYPVALAHDTEFDAVNLTDLLRTVERDIRRLDAAPGAQAELKGECLSRLAALLDERWLLIGEAHSSITMPFLNMMLFWLAVVFFSFGIGAPRNGLAATFVLLVGVSVAAAIYVVLELDGPLDGMVKVSSEPLRHALAHLDVSLSGSP